MQTEGNAPVNGESTVRFFHHDNAPTYWLVVMSDFLAKNNVTTLEHLLYFPDVAAAVFYLFPQLKSALMGWHVCDTTDIMKNAVEELKRLAQNWFQECFQQLYGCWQKRIVAQGDCFEGNVA